MVGVKGKSGPPGHQHSRANSGGKAGASGPPGNGNAIRHGLMAGKLPKGASYIELESERLRTALEDAVVNRTGGEISLHDAAVIQTAIRWERHALLAQRWLRNEAETLTPDQRLAFSRDVARASAERDKCLKALGLDVRPNSDPWSLLDSLPPADSGNDHATEDQIDDSERVDDSSPVDQRSDAADSDGGTSQ
ncbi:MAG: hypothetical protein O3C40_27600 [Planctomycetota bacterium]|nr:hypothetical protein [Planctomycetota bacterium]